MLKELGDFHLDENEAARIIAADIGDQTFVAVVETFDAADQDAMIERTGAVLDSIKIPRGAPVSRQPRVTPSWRAAEHVVPGGNAFRDSHVPARRSASTWLVPSGYPARPDRRGRP